MKYKILLNILFVCIVNLLGGLTLYGQTPQCRHLWHPSVNAITITPNTYGCNNASATWDFTSQIPPGAFNVRTFIRPRPFPCYEPEALIYNEPGAAGSISGLGYRIYGFGVNYYLADTINTDPLLVDTCEWDMYGYGIYGGFNNEGTYLTSAYTNCTLVMVNGTIQVLNNGTLSYELHNPTSLSCAPVSLFKIDETNRPIFPPIAYSFLLTDTFKELEPGPYQLAIITESVNIPWTCGDDPDNPDPHINDLVTFGPDMGPWSSQMIYEDPWLDVVYNLKMDTTLGIINYIPFKGIIVEAHEHSDTSVIAETVTSDSLGRFGFSNLDANTFYDLRFRYQDSLGVADSLYSSYEFLGYKPGDPIGDIYMPYSMLLQTKDLIKSLSDKGNYEMKYLLGMLNMDSISPKKRKTYDFSKIDTLLNQWQNIEQVLAWNTVQNLGRVYLALYATNKFSDDAYTLSKIPPQAASEMVMMVMELAKVAERLKNLVSKPGYAGAKPVGCTATTFSEITGDAFKALLSFSLERCSAMMEARQEALPEGKEKEISALWIKTIKVMGYSIKGIKEGSIAFLTDNIKAILNDQMFIYLYERHMAETQAEIDKTYNAAVILAPPDDNFEAAYYRLLSTHVPSESLFDFANERTGLILNACQMLDSNVAKTDMVKSAGDVLTELVGLSPEVLSVTEAEVKELTSFFKKASLLFDAFKITNYGTELYLGVLRYYQNTVEEGKVHILAFTPSAALPNRNGATASTIYYGNDSIDITRYNNKLDTIIQLIQNNQNAEAVNKTIELHAIDSVLDDAVLTSIKRIEAVANHAINTVPDFDNQYSGFIQVLQNNFSYRASMFFNLTTWIMDTTSATFVDTLIAASTKAKLANQQTCDAIHEMDSITSDVSVSVRMMITNIKTPYKSETGEQNDIKISYQNFGTETATQVYLKLQIDNSYSVDHDSIYIGDVLPNDTGTVSFHVTSLIADTFCVYLATLKAENGEGNYKSDYISTNKAEICNGIDDNENGIIDEGCSVTLNLYVFLEGFYLHGGSMTTLLSNQDMSQDPDAVDSITVELHNAVDPFAKVAEQTGVLKSNGLVQLTFPNEILNNSYYIVAKHRRSLETWSKYPVTFNAVTTFDFTQ